MALYKFCIIIIVIILHIPLHCHYSLQITVDSPKRRSYAAEKLRCALNDSADDVDCETRFYVRLPNSDDHSNHIIGEVSFSHFQADVDQYIAVTAFCINRTLAIYTNIIVAVQCYHVLFVCCIL